MSNKCKPKQVCFGCPALLNANYAHRKAKVGRESTPPRRVGVIFSSFFSKASMVVVCCSKYLTAIHLFVGVSCISYSHVFLVRAFLLFFPARLGPGAKIRSKHVARVLTTRFSRVPPATTPLPFLSLRLPILQPPRRSGLPYLRPGCSQLWSPCPGTAPVPSRGQAAEEAARPRRDCHRCSAGREEGLIALPSVENTELEGSPLKTWGRSVCSRTCYAKCRGFLSNFYLLVHSPAFFLKPLQNFPRISCG